MCILTYIAQAKPNGLDNLEAVSTSILLLNLINMSKTLHISGVLAIVSFLVIRLTPYFEGNAFDKFWFIPMVVLPVGVIAFLTFIVNAITVASKKQSSKNFIIIGLFPVLIIVLPLAPFPSYVDGMHKAVIDSLSRKELMEFVAAARTSNPEITKGEGNTQLVQKLIIKYPKPLKLSHFSPRIDVTDNYVSVFYGSALVKHWGYVVGNLEEFPIEQIPKNMYKKVYDGIWVYHDIW